MVAVAPREVVVTRKVNFVNIDQIHRACGYVTRGRELFELKRCLFGRGSALILGLPRVGKSAFLDDAAHEVEQIQGQNLKIVRLSGLGSDFCLERHQDKRSVSEQLLEKLDVTSRDRLVVLLDEFNRLLEQLLIYHPEELDGLGKVIYECLQNGIRFVLVAQRSPYEQDRFRNFMTGMFPHRTSFTEIVIPPFAEDQLARYCDYSCFPPSTEMRGEILSYTHGRAGLVNLVLRQLNRQYEDKFCEIFLNEIVANHADLQELWEKELRDVVFWNGGGLVDNLKKRLPPGHAARRKLPTVHRKAVAAVDFASACADIRCDAGACGLAQDELNFYNSVMEADDMLDASKKEKLLKAYGVLDEKGHVSGAVRDFQNEAIPAKTAEVVRERPELPMASQVAGAEQGRRLVVDLYKGVTKFDPEVPEGSKEWGSPHEFLTLLLGCRGITSGEVIKIRLNQLREALAGLTGGGNILGKLVARKEYTSGDVSSARSAVNEWSDKHAKCCLMGKTPRGRRSGPESRGAVPAQRTFDVDWLYADRPLFDEQTGRLSDVAVSNSGIRKVLEDFLEK